MDTQLNKLIAERKRLAGDLRRMPSPVNMFGKVIKKEPTAYLRNLDARIKQLKAYNYLGALSMYYEAGNSVEKCIAFVRRYFPKRFTLSI